VAKSVEKATKKLPKPASAPARAPAVALRRGRFPVNPEAEFTAFRSAHRVGAKMEGEVTAFTSHGAVIKVTLKGGQTIECYAPTTLLGDPAPARARDVLQRGDRRKFRLVTVDADRRIAELALL
jgi:ribosomal protein S1